MIHTCHAHGCEARVPPAMFMCREHWYSLRKPMRDAIWREYRRRQEITKTPTLRYLCVANRAIAEVAFKPHDEQAARDASPYILKAETFRALAIDQGAGDPLEGLAELAQAGLPFPPRASAASPLQGRVPQSSERQAPTARKSPGTGAGREGQPPPADAEEGGILRREERQLRGHGGPS